MTHANTVHSSCAEKAIQGVDFLEMSIILVLMVCLVLLLVPGFVIQGVLSIRSPRPLLVIVI